MNKENTGFFITYFKSIFDFNFYHSLNDRPVGSAFIYLLLLTLLLGTISTFPNIYSFNKGMSSVINDIETKLPNFTFENNELNIADDSPIIIGDKKYFYFVVDTNDKYNKTNLDSNCIVLGKDKLFIPDLSGNTQMPYSNYSAFNLTKQSLLQFLSIYKLADIFIIFGGLIYFFISKFIYAFFVSFIGLLLNMAFNTRLSFSNILKLSIFAISLPATFEVILQCFNVTIPFFDLMFYTAAGIYIWKALLVIKINQA